jgi:hypothetical protein
MATKCRTGTSVIHRWAMIATNAELWRHMQASDGTTNEVCRGIADPDKHESEQEKFTSGNSDAVQPHDGGERKHEKD